MSSLNKDFDFSDDSVFKIRDLNSKLKNEEVRISKYVENLNKILANDVNEKQIDDFIINASFCVFSKNANCNKRHNTEQGEPFWKDKSYTLFDENTDVAFYNDNWNELAKEHPLSNEFFCYTMHCLLFHSPLTWQDIVDIDDVWIDLNIRYQFVLDKSILKNETETVI